MRSKLTTLALKGGLTLLLMDIIMLFMISHETIEWIIAWLTFAVLFIFDLVLIILVRKEVKKEEKNEKDAS